jgi:hypothetical protein
MKSPEKLAMRYADPNFKEITSPKKTRNFEFEEQLISPFSLETTHTSNRDDNYLEAEYNKKRQ